MHPSCNTLPNIVITSSVLVKHTHLTNGSYLASQEVPRYNVECIRREIKQVTRWTTSQGSAKLFKSNKSNNYENKSTIKTNGWNIQTHLHKYTRKHSHAVVAVDVAVAMVRARGVCGGCRRHHHRHHRTPVFASSFGMSCLGAGCVMPKLPLLLPRVVCRIEQSVVLYVWDHF